MPDFIRTRLIKIRCNRYSIIGVILTLTIFTSLLSSSCKRQELWENMEKKLEPIGVTEIKPPSDGLIVSTADSNTTFSYVNLLIDKNNRFHVIYNSQTTTPSSDVRYAYYDGAQWVDGLAVADSQISKNCFTAGPSGTMYFSYCLYSAPSAMYASYNAGVWVSTAIPSSTSTDGISMTVDASNYIHYLFRTSSNQLYYSTNRTGTFVNTLLESSCKGAQLIMADSLGGVHAFHNNWSGRTGRYRNNSNWSSYTTLVSYTYDCSPKFSGTVYNDKLYISYRYDNATTTSNLYYSTDASGSWSPVLLGSSLPLVRDDFYLMEDPVNAHVLIVDNNNRMRLYSNRSGSWKDYTVLSSGCGYFIHAGRIGGTLYAAYVADSGKEIYMKSLNVSDYN